MSTFVVRLVGSPSDSFRGKARHVGSGEETFFSCAEELVAFMEGINVLKEIGAGDPEEEEPE